MNLEEINEPLLEWFYKHKRYMPWREKPNFYYVWLSEIMLQQTRVDTVMSYFEHFIKEVPNIEILANIKEDKLLKLWEGLGYYNRARNSKIAANQIMKDYGGIPPKDYEDILSLKGIGEYTAGAISSIVYNKRVAAVDGNVLRVMTRILKDDSDIMLSKTKKKFKEIIEASMPDNARDYTQALMELGALICLPNGEPKCSECPLSFCCGAYLTNTIKDYPVKKIKKSKKIEKRSVFLIVYKNQVLIQKRKNQGLLKGLYEYPNMLGHVSKVEMKYIFDEMGLDTSKFQKLPSAKHIFSHLEWHMEGYFVPINKKIPGLWATYDELRKEYSIPTAFKVYTKELEKYLKSI